MAAVRFIMACLSLFFLPLSIVAFPIYMALVYVFGKCPALTIGKYPALTNTSLYLLVSNATLLSALYTFY